MSNQPISEQYRLAALEWVDLDNAARLLEETKTIALSTSMKALGDLPVTSAEREVKCTLAWKEFVESIVTARTKANRSKVQLEFLRMQHSEQMSMEASIRHEMRLS